MSDTTRRDFLITSAALAAGSLLAPMSARTAQAAQGTELTGENRGRIYKANKGGFLGNTEEEIVALLERYKKLGFDGIEAASPGLNVAAVNAAVAKVGLPVHGIVDNIHWEQRLSSPDAAIREAGLQGLLESMRDSRAINGSAVLLVPGKVSGPDENHEHVWNRSIVEIRKALPLASKIGMPILIENVWNGFCETPEQLRDYIDEINSPWVGVYFDIGNVRKFSPPEEWIAVLGNRIQKLDVKDWGVKNSFCRLGEGDVDWVSVRGALKQIGYTGWATREGDDKSLEDTAELMNKLLDL